MTIADGGGALERLTRMASRSGWKKIGTLRQLTDRRRRLPAPSWMASRRVT
jgi:hypothetical protein